MKQYLLSVHYVEGAEPPPPEQMQTMFRDVATFNQKLQDTGNWVFGCGLHEPSSSTVVTSSGLLAAIATAARTCMVTSLRQMF